MHRHLRYFPFCRYYRFIHRIRFDCAESDSLVSEYAGAKYITPKEEKCVETRVEKQKQKQAYRRFLHMVEPREEDAILEREVEKK